MAKQKTDIEKYFTKIYGEGIILKTSENKITKFVPERYLSSGSYELNRILSGHHKFGMLRGRLMEVYGPEGSGKTTLTLHFAAEATRRKINTFFIDAEHAIDEYYAKSIGVDMKYFKIFQPETIEDSFEISWELLNKFDYKLGIYDSIAAMRPAAELQGTMNDDQMALHARKMNKAIVKASKEYSRNKAWGILINQTRTKIGVFFGDPEFQPGGKAVKFYTSYRLDIRNPRGDKVEETIKKNTLSDLIDEQEIKKAKKNKERVETGTVTNVRTVKNKLAPPKKKIKLKIIYGKGIDKLDDLIKFLEYITIIEMGEGKNKKKVIYNDEMYTADRFGKMLKEKDFKKEIKKKIKQLTD